MSPPHFVKTVLWFLNILSWLSTSAPTEHLLAQCFPIKQQRVYFWIFQWYLSGRTKLWTGDTFLRIIAVQKTTLPLPDFSNKSEKGGAISQKQEGKSVSINLTLWEQSSRLARNCKTATVQTMHSSPATWVKKNLQLKRMDIKYTQGWIITWKIIQLESI